MYLDDKKIFIAGATGMAGSSLIRHILDNYPGVAVRASYNRTAPFLLHERVDYVKGDLTSAADCIRMIKGCDCAIMAAAYTGGAAFRSSFPWEHMRQNLMMNMQLLEAVRAEKIGRVGYIGSATLYQEFDGHITEDELDMNRDPHSAYFGFGWAARFIEKACRFLHEQCGTEVVIARSANIFGPYAKFDPKASNFIPAIIRKAVDRMDPFEVWGSPFVTRDVIYADDFAAAIAKMLDNDSIPFGIFNIGSGEKTTVGDVVEWALRYAGHTPGDIRYIQDGAAAAGFRALDCSRARNLLGWAPQNTVEEGVRKTVEWWLNNKEWWKK